MSRSVSRRNWTREGHFVTVATRYPSLPPSLPLSARKSARRWKKRKKRWKISTVPKVIYFLSERDTRDVCATKRRIQRLIRSAQHLFVVRSDTPFDRNESWPRKRCSSFQFRISRKVKSNNGAITFIFFFFFSLFVRVSRGGETKSETSKRASGRWKVGDSRSREGEIGNRRRIPFLTSALRPRARRAWKVGERARAEWFVPLTWPVRF